MVKSNISCFSLFDRDLAVLQLLSQVSHPWVNQYMQVVGHAELHKWDGTDPPMIGDIVVDVIREFERDAPTGGSSGHSGQNPPSWGDGRLQGIGYTPSQNTPMGLGLGLGGPRVITDVEGVKHGRSEPTGIPESSNSGHGQGREMIAAIGSRRHSKDHTPIPAIPTKFKELEGLTTYQLDRLLEDDVARQALLLGMTGVASMKDLKTDVCKGNVETARLTLSKQECARVLREQGERMRQELKELQTSYEGAP